MLRPNKKKELDSQAVLIKRCSSQGHNVVIKISISTVNTDEREIYPSHKLLDISTFISRISGCF